MKKPLYAILASTFDAWNTCRSHSDTWEERHRDRIERLCREHLPSGSGVDNGCTFAFELSKPDRLVIQTSFHHMNEHGGYDGWTEHAVIVTPSLAFGCNVRVTGRDRNETKEYLAERLCEALSAEYEEYV